MSFLSHIKLVKIIFLKISNNKNFIEYNFKPLRFNL